MAKERLSEKALFVARGFGQVEPNHLSAQRTGQIYAQLPANKDITVLENGQFAKYDYQNNEVNFTGAGEWLLVYNEVKIYRDDEVENDFALQSKNGLIVPRLFKTNVGDIYTTNCIAIEAPAVGNVLAPGADGYLTTAGDDATMKWEVVKVYTLADRQPAVKLMRIA